MTNEKTRLSSRVKIPPPYVQKRPRFYRTLGKASEARRLQGAHFSYKFGKNGVRFCHKFTVFSDI